MRVAGVVVLLTGALTISAASANVQPARRASVRAARSTGFFVSQIEFPPPLVVRGERIEVGYDAQTTPNAQKIPNATGTLYVRNDLQRSFTTVPLKLRKRQVGPPWPEGTDTIKLRAFVPNWLLVGDRLFYYAVIRDRLSARSVTVPTGGARAPESVWIINNAVRVNLGTYAFGHLAPPGAVVARAGLTQVGFNTCAPGGECGQPSGPASFEVASDRSIWLLDQLNSRLLVWGRGQPDTVARTVPLSFAPFGDFALGPAGSLYVVRGYSKGPPVHPGGWPSSFPPLQLSRVSMGGNVVWTRKLDTDDASVQLRTGPDGTLYWTGGGSGQKAKEGQGWRPWAPAVTPVGRSLPMATQERRVRWTQPLPGGRQLVLATTGWTGLPWTPEPHEVRVALLDRASRVVRAWRITSRTIIEPAGAATPALVGGDPAVVLFPTRPSGGTYQSEYLVLRLGPKGVRTRFSLPFDEPPRSAYAGYTITEIRVQPDGKLYQLGSAPDFGAAIYEYSLAPTP